MRPSETTPRGQEDAAPEEPAPKPERTRAGRNTPARTRVDQGETNPMSTTNSTTQHSRHNRADQHIPSPREAVAQHSPNGDRPVERQIRAAAQELRRVWETDPRWAGVRRDYAAEDVVRLRGSVPEEHTLARVGAERLWKLLHERDYVAALGALTGNQAVQQVRAGLEAIYLSGWQVAADANLAGQTYPDQSLYPANSVPQVVRRINNALQRADQITWAEGNADAPYWLAPIVADAEAGFGGVLNAFELMKAMIAAGAAGVHWEDQLASEKKCGHLGGKVLIPTGQHIRTLNAARLAADVSGVPSLIIARTDAQAATLVTSDVDERDRVFVTGERTAEGFYRVTNGLAACVSRGLAYAPYSDLLWMETSKPDLGVAREFAEAIKAEYPDQMLAYNCSPSFNWKQHLDDGTIAKFQRELGEMGYAFQFITLAGFHALNESMFELAKGYAREGMTAYVALQEREFAAERDGYTATRHQREVGTGYFDLVSTAISPQSATTALTGSTEEEQFISNRR
ncbi:isocitrate lyase [Actinopolymorpha singaporensis]|uniref:Isocitrate lyase n=2 Tax=Actinopolymorpha singaporensis TaxID=117157 RepID=A0A1H1QLY1_9ACTN|nr:isocitrate lyase [Actinopolymorpha singaporensis]